MKNQVRSPGYAQALALAFHQFDGFTPRPDSVRVTIQPDARVSLQIGVDDEIELVVEFKASTTAYGYNYADFVREKKMISIFLPPGTKSEVFRWSDGHVRLTYRFAPQTQSAA